MKYFILKPDISSRKIGSAYPQVQEMAPGYNYDANDSVYALSSETESIPNYTPNLDYFVVHPRAIITDVLSTSVVSGGLLMNNKVKNILQKYNLPIHKYFPAKVNHKNVFYDYYWMHIVCDLTDFINYEKSTFFIYYNYSKNLGYVNIESKIDLSNKKQKLKTDNPGKSLTIWADEIVFSKEFNNTFDLFEIGLFDANFYISLDLKNTLISEDVSGLVFADANNLVFDHEQ